MTSDRVPTSDQRTVMHPSRGQILVPRGTVPQTTTVQDREMLFTIPELKDGKLPANQALCSSKAS
jgi:hypothetical protein